MTKIVCRTLAFLLVSLMLLPTLAEETPSLPDLSGNAPEGTFLAEGEAPQWGEDSYRDQHISIKITKHRQEEARADIYVADIYVTSVAYLRRGFSLNEWKGDMRSIKTIAPDHNAILAMTGDYASLLNSGLVAANGEIYRKTNNKARDNCLVLTDGRMLTYPRQEMALDEALELPLWHSFLFGPELLHQGEAIEKFTTPIRVANPRSALGYFSPGHYCFVVVDGRSTQSRGVTLEQLSQFMKELGCQAAYNLDGGQSAVMWFHGEFVNKPYKGGRRLTDIVYIGHE